MVKARFLQLVALALLACSGTSCMSHRNTVGLGPTGLGESTARQYYVMFGLLRFNEVDPKRMADSLTSYEVETSYSFVDILLMPILLPLTATSRTVTVRK